ncbi:MAG: hypothetical protein ABJN26_06140 [Stappiaceae bacterium]
MAETVSQELIAEISKQARAQFVKWMIAAIVALFVISLSGWWFVLDKELKEYISENAGGVPKGAVLAFAIECPKDWDVYKPATARMIIGAGEEFHPKHATWDQQRLEGGKEEISLTPRALHYSGGEEAHILKVNEIASHDHDYHDFWWKGSGFITGGPIAALQGGSNEYDPHNAGYQTAMKGGNQAHNNMPPFIALYYCMKN